MTKEENLSPVRHSSFGILHSSFAACGRITRAANSSFPLAFHLLPPHKRRAMDALYAFSRVTDDLADAPGEPVAKREALGEWRAGLTAAIAGKYSHPIHAALYDTVRRFAIPPRYLFDLIDGVEQDLEPVRFASFADLYRYCYRVASAVGLACVRVWGLRPGAMWDETDPPAEAAGIAFQLTNILRDLGEDDARGRVYLPEDELKRCGIVDLTLRVRSPHAEREVYGEILLRFQAERARDFYHRAEPLDRLLTADGRAIFRVMCGTYRALLDEIERRGFDVFTQRVRVPRWRKAAIFLTAWPVKWGWW